MTEPQTFYAVLDGKSNIVAGPYENADKAHHVAEREAKRWGGCYRVIRYTVIATYE